MDRYLDTFISDFQPLHEDNQLIDISRAYPLANFIYKYAGKEAGVYARLSIRNGITVKATDEEMETKVKREPAFMTLIEKSS